jgi:hypothetical protein
MPLDLEAHIDTLPSRPAVRGRRRVERWLRLGGRQEGVAHPDIRLDRAPRLPPARAVGRASRERRSHRHPGTASPSTPPGRPPKHRSEPSRERVRESLRRRARGRAPTARNECRPLVASEGSARSGSADSDRRASPSSACPPTGNVRAESVANRISCRSGRSAYRTSSIIPARAARQLAPQDPRRDR